MHGMHIPLAGGAHPGGPHPLGGRRGGRWAWDLMHICVIVIILITTIASCLLPLSVRSTVRYGTVRHGTARHSTVQYVQCVHTIRYVQYVRYVQHVQIVR